MERRTPDNEVERHFKTRRNLQDQDNSEKSIHAVSGLGLWRLNVTCCSDMYSSAGKSVEVHSYPESAYIYNESIQACDTLCSGISQDYESVNLDREDRNIADVLPYHISDNNQGCSLEAVFGSDCSTDESDSRSGHKDWKSAFDCYGDLYHSLHSLVSAHWGSASSQSDSEASGYTTDCEVSSSCNLDRHSGLNFANLDSLDVSCENVSWDLYNSYNLNSYNGHNITLDVPRLGCQSEPFLGRLKGVVTLVDRSRFSTFFCEMMKKAVQDKNEEKQLISEGFLFHPQQVTFTVLCFS